MLFMKATATMLCRRGYDGSLSVPGVEALPEQPADAVRAPQAGGVGPDDLQRVVRPQQAEGVCRRRHRISPRGSATQFSQFIYLCRDRRYDFKNIISKKLAFLTQNRAKLCKKLSQNWFVTKRQFFAENCDRFIIPIVARLGELSPSGRLLSLGSFLKITVGSPIFLLLFSTEKIIF
jgi:hypothetical protein